MNIQLFFIHESAKRVWPSGLLQPIMNHLNFQLFKLFQGLWLNKLDFQICNDINLIFDELTTICCLFMSWHSGCGQEAFSGQ